MSSQSVAALVMATGLWAASAASYALETPRRPAGEAWVVTSSDKIASRPMLMRANVPFKTAAR
jgi:hypothetical protein